MIDEVANKLIEHNPIRYGYNLTIVLCDLCITPLAYFLAFTIITSVSAYEVAAFITGIMSLGLEVFLWGLVSINRRHSNSLGRRVQLCWIYVRLIFLVMLALLFLVSIYPRVNLWVLFALSLACLLNAVQEFTSQGRRSWV